MAGCFECGLPGYSEPSLCPICSKPEPKPCKHPRMKGHYAGMSSHLLYICPDCGFELVDFV